MYIVSEVCSEWTRKKLFVYAFLYAVQSMTPHTGCMIVLLNYMYDTTHRVHDCTTKLYV